jgi:NtrC-family two-component system response regulator AlgB
MSPEDISLNILVVDDERNIRKTLSMCLESEGHEVTCVSSYQEAVSQVAARSFDAAFIDIRLGAANGIDLIPVLLATSPWLKIIMITAYASVETAVEAIRRGAKDYIPKPFTPAQVKLVISKIAEVHSLQRRIEALQKDLGRLNPEADFGSKSHSMQRAIHLARQVAPSDAVILILGENGTGKSMLARAIHAWSKRSEKAFAVVSCPTLSSELLESELFGHVRGAFTGAVQDSYGRIAACDGGTLLLDEIGDLPLTLQPKLLRFIQDREYERVGDNITRKANVRLIAATNMDLEKAVRENRFREDLFYRLNVIQIEIPPLRERPDDIRKLAQEMLVFFSRGNHRNPQRFTTESLEVLSRYDWPGNVRELRNVVERSSILCESDWISADYLPENLQVGEMSVRPGDLVSLDRLEEAHICKVLAQTKSLQEAANILGIDQATLWRRRKKYNI